MTWTPTKEMLLKAAQRQREQAKAGREFAAVLQKQGADENAVNRQALIDAQYHVQDAARFHEQAAMALTRAAHALE